MSDDAQIDLFGGETPVEELEWPGTLRALAAHERELGVRLSADEAGAWLHHRRGKHETDVRCHYCTTDGRDVLTRLRNRAPLSEGAEQTTRSPHRLADASASSPRAHARPTDPQTSQAAARSVRALRDSQNAVLKLLRELGPMDDVLLIERYQEAVLEGLRPNQSPSGIRSRRAELVEAGEVRDSGRKVRTEGGRNAIVWELAVAIPSPSPYDDEPDL